LTYCLETTNIVHKYSDDVVLDGISLQVPCGSIYGFLGPNGAGKTTTLRLVLGLLRKQQGAISVFGKCFDTHRIEILRQVGSLIESPSVYEHLTATENLSLLQKVYQVPRARIGEVLEVVGLSQTGRKKAGQFSLGMKQRLGIAATLLHRPSLLILDEPTNGLDPNGIIEIRDLLIELNAREGMTIVISSHLLSEIEKLVTHAGIICKGRMMFQGTLAELKKKERQAGSVAVSTNDDARALEVLREDGVGASMVNGEIVMPAMSNERIAGINRRLIEKGLDVHKLSAMEDDLEAIFMNMVRG